MKFIPSNVPETYHLSSAFREHDIYLPDMNWKSYVTDFFPATFTDIVQGLSNTTSSFYGLMLKEAAKLYGTQVMDQLSKATLYELGRKICQNVLDRKPDMERNAQGIAIIVFAALFSASPEYQFEVRSFEADHVKLLIKGVDRYHRIAKQLDFDSELTWPVVVPFVQGINDQLGLTYTIRIDVVKLDEQSHCLYDLYISL